MPKEELPEIAEAGQRVISERCRLIALFAKYTDANMS